LSESPEVKSDSKRLLEASCTPERRTRLEAQAHLEFQELCPFRPQIDVRSRSLARGKRPAHVSLHEHLYREAQERTKREENLREEILRSHPYKPDIGVNASHCFKEEANVVERLSKVPPAQEDPNLTHDPETGQPWFNPNVGRGPLFNRNAGNLPP